MGMHMLKMNAKQLMAILLSLLLVQPMPMAAGTVAPNSSRTVLGSINSRGPVQVGSVPVPGMSTLFSGDVVRTDAGSAVIQYRDGVRVVLGGATEASFTADQVALQKGLMSFDTRAEGPAFAASTLRLEPTSARSSANVTLGDHQASVAVTEGTVNVVDPSGALLASLAAGEARLFAEAPAAEPAPAAAAPAAAAPQMGGSGGNGWLLALGVGIVGTSLGIAGLVRANNANDRADEAEAAATAAASQVASLQSSITALNTQLTSVQSQLTSLQATVSAGNPLLAQLASALANVNQLQSQLLSTQNQLNQLLTSIAAQGGVPTAAQLSQLQSLSGLLNSLFQQVQNAINNANNLVNQLIGVISGT